MHGRVPPWRQRTRKARAENTESDWLPAFQKLVTSVCVLRFFRFVDERPAHAQGGGVSLVSVVAGACTGCFSGSGAGALQCVVCALRQTRVEKSDSGRAC